MKVMDNLQIFIESIHIRFENDEFDSYSFGITLDKLNIYTTNKNGE